MADRDHRARARELRSALLRAAAGSDGPLTAADLVPTATATTNANAAIAVPRGTYAEMHRALLHQVVGEAGSIRKAARQLAVPRSTLAAWLSGAG